MTIPQSPITTESNPMIPPAPLFKKKTKWGKIIAGIVALVVVIGGGVWGYQKIVVKPQVAELIVYTGADAQANCTNALAGSNNNACMQDGDNQWHATHCQTGYVPGPDGIGCIEASRDIGRQSWCADSPGTNLSCVEGGTRYSGCKCCPPGTNASVTSTFTIDTQQTGAEGCGFGNIQTATQVLSTQNVCVPTEGAPGHCDDITVTTWRLTCQRVTCEGSATPTPSPVTPVMACTSITSIPAASPAPVVGTKMTFTCLGTVTPASAGTVSYKFQYSINSAAPLALAPLTATPNKAELTINACGTYKVQCKACATIGGVLTCAPEWAAVK